MAIRIQLYEDGKMIDSLIMPDNFPLPQADDILLHDDRNNYRIMQRYFNVCEVDLDVNVRFRVEKC